MKRIYIDANVLIAAFQGEERIAQRVLRALDDPSQKIVVSDYLRLEVLPKPTFNRRQEEIDFMLEIFDGADENIVTSPEVTRRALEFASKYDLSPVDALHVGIAAVAGVDELITMEKPTKPICRVKEVNVVSIHSDSEVAH